MDFLERKVGDLARENFTHILLFNENNIDYFCKGNRTLKQAIEEDGADEAKVLESLNMVKKTINPIGYIVHIESWPLDLLADYIQKIHHRYTEKAISEIKAAIEPIIQAGGAEGKILEEFKPVFEMLGGGMAMHMKSEELMVFPAIKKIVKNMAGPVPKYGTLDKAVATMEEEHDMQYKALQSIHKILDKYAPREGQEAYNKVVKKMSDLDKDLGLHIHLENNILFPKSIKMIKELA